MVGENDGAARGRSYFIELDIHRQRLTRMGQVARNGIERRFERKEKCISNQMRRDRRGSGRLHSLL